MVPISKHSELFGGGISRLCDAITKGKIVLSKGKTNSMVPNSKHSELCGGGISRLCDEIAG